jgi:hypothetical protein
MLKLTFKDCQYVANGLVWHRDRARRDPQQRAGGPLRRALTLLPLARRSDGHANTSGERDLRQAHLADATP